MDQRKLIAIIRRYPPVWDRNHLFFRDKELKEKTWYDISNEIGYPKDSCKETFKSLREKYIREREKSTSDVYQEWYLLNDLKFLDPYILPRKIPLQHNNNTEDTYKLDIGLNTPAMSLAPVNQNIENNTNNPTTFDLALIAAVRQTMPLWDRNCNTYPNKPMKHQLWINIAKSLNKDVNNCMLRWKALREKYIRQKIKFFQEGDTKWELLDELSFLDKVIQYRRKHSDASFYASNNLNDTSIQNNSGGSGFSQSSYSSHWNENNSLPESKNNHIHIETNDDNSYTDSSNDFLAVVKQEGGAVLQVADSSYNSDTSYSRKRSESINSEASIIENKRTRSEEVPSHSLVTVNKTHTDENVNREEKEKTPEQLFGDLVAVLLSKKPEKERNLYMIEIMTVLSK